MYEPQWYRGITCECPYKHLLMSNPDQPNNCIKRIISPTPDEQSRKKSAIEK
jgi:hypothetical protein